MSFHTFIFLAQAAGQTAQQQAPQTPPSMGPTLIVYLVCFAVIVYFMMIRPQSQQRKKHDALMKSLETGDKVVTSAGIHGLISNVKETTVLLKVADNVKIEVDKASIGSVTKRTTEAKPAAKT